MVYGEVGTPPVIVEIKTRVLLFWSSVIMCYENNKCNTISSYYTDYYLNCMCWMSIVHNGLYLLH